MHDERWVFSNSFAFSSLSLRSALMKLACNPLLFRIRLIGLCLACAVPPATLAQLQTILSPITRTDREYFVCDDTAKERSCFDQYVAFSDQYVPTRDPTVAIEDLRCASFGSERSDATFSLSGRLVERAAGQALSLSPRILKIRFYSKGASGEPIELPRSDLTYVLARTLTESKLLSETTAGNELSVRKFAKYFPDCRAIHFVATELLPFVKKAEGRRTTRAIGRNAGNARASE